MFWSPITLPSRSAALVVETKNPPAGSWKALSRRPAVRWKRPKSGIDDTTICDLITVNMNEHQKNMLERIFFLKFSWLWNYNHYIMIYCIVILPPLYKTTHLNNKNTPRSFEYRGYLYSREKDYMVAISWIDYPLWVSMDSYLFTYMFILCSFWIVHRS